MLASWLMSSTAYSQTTVLSNSGDTTICFTIGKAKFLLKRYYDHQKMVELYSICSQEISLADSIIGTQKSTIENQKEIAENQQEIDHLKDQEIAQLKQNLKTERKNTRKQKVQKFVAIGTGVVVSGLMAVLYLAK